MHHLLQLRFALPTNGVVWRSVSNRIGHFDPWPRAATEPFMSKSLSIEELFVRQSSREKCGDRESFVKSCLPLITRPTSAVFSHGEQHFSVYAHRQLLRLLSGKAHRFRLMHRYYETDEIGFFLPPKLDRADISASVAEGIIYGVLKFLHPFGEAGPIAQRDRGGKLTEIQLFPTRYAHLVIKRQSRYDTRSRRLTEVDWQVLSIHDQKSKLFEGAMDLGKMAIDIAKFLPIL